MKTRAASVLNLDLAFQSSDRQINDRVQNDLNSIVSKRRQWKYPEEWIT